MRTSAPTMFKRNADSKKRVQRQIGIARCVHRREWKVERHHERLMATECGWRGFSSRPGRSVETAGPTDAGCARPERARFTDWLARPVLRTRLEEPEEAEAVFEDTDFAAGSLYHGIPGVFCDPGLKNLKRLKRLKRLKFFLNHNQPGQLHKLGNFGTSPSSAARRCIFTNRKPSGWSPI